MVGLFSGEAVSSFRRLARLTLVLALALSAAPSHAGAETVLRVGDHLHRGAVVGSTVHAAILASFLAAGVVGVVVALGAAVESRRQLSRGSAARLHRAVSAVALATLLVVLVGGLVRRKTG